jgi:hypothetical protein
MIIKIILKMRTTFLLYLCLLTALISKGQTVKGKISDASISQSLPFVSLALTDQINPSSVRYLSTDTSGNFEFRQIPNGSYTLTASLIGYQKIQIKLTINTNILDLGNIAMTENPNLLQTVTINGGTPAFATRNGQINISVSGNTFFKSTANLMDVFRKLPGLQVNPDGTMLLGNGSSPTLFVDGRPVNMNGDEIQAYLNSLSPDMVESIEMINQPSSKYDGQYKGIIDVKLKRSQSMGLRGTYNLRFQQNNNSLLDNNLALGYKTGQFLYGLSLGQTTGSTYYRYHALQYLANTNAMITDTRTITAQKNYNIQARIAFEPKKGQSLEAFLRTYQINRNAVVANQLTTKTNDLNNTLSILQSNNDGFPKQHNYSGGINYDALFKTGELHILTAIAQIDNRQTEDIRNTNQLNNVLVDYWKTKSRNNIVIRSIQADYTQNLNTGKLELGGKYAYTSTANNLRYDTLGNGSFNPDPKRSNLFNYQEYIAAGYLSYLKSSGKFSYSLSLRAEHTRTLANSITEGTLTERSYLKWLPSASLTYEITTAQQLSFSYSRRLTRPTFNALNPFRFYFSPRNYWIGNPYLQPSTTNLFSLSYSKKALNISINAGRENDPMVRYPEYDPITNILAYMGTNLPYRDFVNILASSPITMNEWWRMNNSLGLYYNRELMPYLGQTYKIPVFNYIWNGSQIFTLRKWLVDLSYNYQSKSGNSLYITSPVYTFDLGLQRSWFNSRLNSKLSVQDVFNKGQQRLIFREKKIIDNDFYHDNGTRRLVFSLTYNFGRSIYKAKEDRKSEEENRVNR